MGQIEIAKILKRSYPKYLTIEEIIEVTGLSKATVCHSLKKLTKRNEIQYKMFQGPLLRSGWKKTYRYKEEK